MGNKVIVSNDTLQHYGVLGMKWGVRRANYASKSLTAKVRSTTNKYDRGRDIKPDRVRKLSKKVRREKHFVEGRIKRAERFLAKSAKADAKKIVNRYNRDPEKKKAVENYIKALQPNTVTLNELRMELIDIRI
jgi:hypothetical protein